MLQDNRVIEDFDIGQIVTFAKSNWKFILANALLAIMIASAYLYSAPRKYTAVTELLIDPDKSKLTKDDLQDNRVNQNDLLVENQISIINSSAVLRRIVLRDKLFLDPEFSSNGKPIIGSENAKDQNSEENIALTVNKLRDVIEVTRQNKNVGQVIDIAVTTLSPSKSAELANHIGEAYIKDASEARIEKASHAAEWLRSRVAAQSQKVEDLEEQLIKARAVNPGSRLIGKGSEKRSVSDEQLGQLADLQLKARAEMAEKEAIYKQLISDREQSTSKFWFGTDPKSEAFSELRTQAYQLKQKYAELAARYQTDHPSLVVLRAQMKEVENQIRKQQQNLLINAKMELDLARAKVDALAKTANQVDIESAKADESAIKIKEIEQKISINKAFLDDMTQRMRANDELSTFEASNARVITAAFPPLSPSSPKVGLVLSSGLLIGLIFGSFAAYIRDALRSGFVTSEQVEDKLNIKVLSLLPTIDQNSLKTPVGELSIPHYVHSSPNSRFAESIRAIKNKVDAIASADTSCVILITSTTAKEGKTTTALSLAASMVTSNKKTLIIDCDHRHLSLTKYLHAEGSKGVSDYLLEGGDLENLLGFDDTLGFYFLPNGRRSDASVDLIGSRVFKDMISTLRNKFDRIVIDGLPAGLFDDPSILANYSDTVLYMVRWNYASRRAVAQSIAKFEPGKITGVALTMVDLSRANNFGEEGGAVKDETGYFVN
jgi:polysaccharide biosynthesis transport protein